ncbi:hypothetical protein B0H13DRAFT_2673108 [Mycena leptocephala]|nr:hypothetical protein B0H13DRAFT_2673108 [Mycena leptocephala]
MSNGDASTSDRIGWGGTTACSGRGRDTLSVHAEPQRQQREPVACRTLRRVGERPAWLTCFSPFPVLRPLCAHVLRLRGRAALRMRVVDASRYNTALIHRPNGAYFLRIDTNSSIALPSSLPCSPLLAASTMATTLIFTYCLPFPFSHRYTSPSLLFVCYVTNLLTDMPLLRIIVAAFPAQDALPRGGPHSLALAAIQSSMAAYVEAWD